MIASLYHRSVSYGPNTVAPSSQEPRRRLIEHRAYKKWKAKGCPTGTAVQDWLEAEQEVDAQLKIECNPYLCRTQMPAELVVG
jgi:hypothetical protein